MKKRCPGRPPLDDDDSSTEVGVTFPTKQYDAYARRALLADVSVPEIIRRDLRDTDKPCPNKHRQTPRVDPDPPR